MTHAEPCCFQLKKVLERTEGDEWDKLEVTCEPFARKCVTSFARSSTGSQMLEIENKLLLDSLPGMAYRCDVDAPWRMHYVSPGVRFVCSYSSEDFTSDRVQWGALIHADDLPAIGVELADAIRRRRQFNFHYRIVDPALGIRWVNEAGQAIYASGGDAEALVGFIIDVTEYEQIQEQLREAEQRYALAARATGEIIWDRNLTTGEVRRRVPENSVFHSADPDEAVTHDWWETRVHPDDAEEVQQRIDQLIRKGGSYWSAEYRFRRPEGTYANILDQGFLVLSEEGSARRMVGAMQDISERKAAEAQLEELQAELIHVSQNAAMGAMAATLAHELNQPLAAAGNYVVGSKNLISDSLGADHQAAVGLDEAAQQIHRAGEIIRRMRGLVRNDAGRREEVSLTRLIGRVKKLLHASAICPDLSLSVSIPKSTDCVSVDPIQIEQVLLNLFRNACEAMAGLAKPEIRVRARMSPEGLVEVQVIDNGKGMSPATLTSLFTAYGVSTTGGLGVGLSICRTIMEAHGGRIWAENNADAGVTFHLSVPAGA